MLLRWESSHAWDYAARTAPRDPEQYLALETKLQNIEAGGKLIRSLEELGEVEATNKGRLEIERIQADAVGSVIRWLRSSSRRDGSGFGKH